MLPRFRNTAIAFAVAAVLFRVLQPLIEAAIPALFSIAIVSTMLSVLFRGRGRR